MHLPIISILLTLFNLPLILAGRIELSGFNHNRLDVPYIWSAIFVRTNGNRYIVTPGGVDRPNGCYGPDYGWLKSFCLDHNRKRAHVILQENNKKYCYRVSSDTGNYSCEDGLCRKWVYTDAACEFCTFCSVGFANDVDEY
jgi:hypothetical protein